MHAPPPRPPTPLSLIQDRGCLEAYVKPWRALAEAYAHQAGLSITRGFIPYLSHYPC